MDLYIIRHGIAADSASSDRERPLTQEGRKQLRRLGEYLSDRGSLPELVISSPLIRAVQTAEILSDAAGLEREDLLVSEIMAPGANPEKLCALLAKTDFNSIAVVGHAPDVQVYTSFFTGGGWMTFGRANIACLEIDGPPLAGSGKLNWFLSPRTLGF